MMNLDAARMDQVTRDAFDKVGDSRRWQTAIVRAKQIIETNPYIHLMQDGTLLMLSESGEIYEVGRGFCPCKAFQSQQPCKHRAVRQLILRYIEAAH